jgi:cytochrome c biogenesis protein CcdA/DsbC/DsbD-like thiol-disulfide interchange protein
VAAALTLAVVSVGYAQPRVRAELAPIVDADGVRAGQQVRAALQIRLPDGYHVNSNKPRDETLIPIVLTVSPPAGVTVTEIVYPKPTDLKQRGSDQPLSVFEHEFTIGVAMTVAADMALGEVTIPAMLRYQACDETMCYSPARVETGWSVPVVGRGAPVKAQHADVFKGIAFGHGEAPKPAAPSIASEAPAAAPRPAETAAARDTGDPAARLAGFTIEGTGVGYMGSADFLQFVRNAENGVQEKGLFEGRGPLAILLIVFLGGLALNLTPCVLPLIPINLAIIGAGTRAGSRGRGFWLGAAYGGAMAVVYGVLGLIVILTAGSFGTINSSPWFNAGIAVLFVVLALAMFDVLVIDFSKYSSQVKIGTPGRGTFLVAFTMGAVAALLAGACVAPVVIQVVLFSSNLYATGTTAALALPFFLGIGMAVPWPILGAGLAALPKPGAWMVHVKQAFGVFILATAAYYGYESYSIFSNRWVDASEVASSVEEKLKEGWHASLAEGLDVATREQKPVLIDLWATWCKNCLTMDKTTLADSQVTSALDGYIKIKFQAENPDEAPAKQVMQRLGSFGLPTYVILRPRPAGPTGN